MDLALKIADANAPKLDTGIADKLRGAASSMDQGADLFGRTAAPRARQESVHLHFGRVGSRPPSGAGASVAGGKPAGFAARTRGAALQASAARTASG